MKSRGSPSLEAERKDNQACAECIAREPVATDHHEREYPSPSTCDSNTPDPAGRPSQSTAFAGRMAPCLLSLPPCDIPASNLENDQMAACIRSNHFVVNNMLLVSGFA
jgi:hypothetical protein